MDREDKAILAALGTMVFLVLVVLPLAGSLLTGNWEIALGAAVAFGVMAGVIGLLDGLRRIFMKIFK